MYLQLKLDLLLGFFIRKEFLFFFFNKKRHPFWVGKPDHSLLYFFSLLISGLRTSCPSYLHFHFHLNKIVPFLMFVMVSRIYTYFSFLFFFFLIISWPECPGNSSIYSLTDLRFWSVLYFIWLILSSLSAQFCTSS